MPKHINIEERKAIDYYLKCNWKQKDIAKVLNREPDVISKEIKRNTDEDGIYKYGFAQNKYLERRKKAKQNKKKIQNDISLQYVIEKELKKYLSPEQIAGRLNLESKQTVVCHETIYQWIYKERIDLIQYLCFQKSKFRRKRGTKIREKQRRINQFRNIEERPIIADERIRIGDFEGDTIIGKNKKQRLLTHVDRKSGYGMADLLKEVSAEIIEKKTIERFQNIPINKRCTITYDRGTEFGGEDSILEKKTKTEVYRANPYHSWERGSSENFNGLIRRFLPKGTDFDTLEQADVEKIINILNHRPRKRLGYLTPHEVFVQGLNLVAFQTRM